MGLCEWIYGKQNKALSWFRKSVEEGKKLGAKLELARTYTKIGERLSENNTHIVSLDGVSADQYLKMGKELVDDLNPPN